MLVHKRKVRLLAIDIEKMGDCDIRMESQNKFTELEAGGGGLRVGR